MTIRIKFLGQGDFAQPIKQVIEKRLKLVSDNHELLVVANYGRILKAEEINEPKFGTLNIHPSLLPKYRGATPLQAAILNGDLKTGVCVIKMIEKVDAGPILACEEISIEPNDDLQTLTQKTAKLAAKILPYIILSYISGSINPTPQNDRDASYSKKLTKNEGELNLSKTPIQLQRQVRAYNPWPGSFIILNGKRLVIHKAKIIENKFLPELVQLEGKNPISWQDFLRGWRGDLPI